MGWREAVLRQFGPGVLAGIALPDWARVLWRERFAVSPSCLPRALSITTQSIKNSVWGAFERRRCGARVKNATIQPPLFVLGHWRSGTTHLHNLLCLDPRFAFPNNYQVSFPHTFLSTEAISSRLLSLFLPRRRPMDNIEWSMESPQEDEFALCASTLMSPCMAWVFSERRERFEKYLTMEGLAPPEISEWREGFEFFLRKLSFKYGRPLVLKSPPHTARVRLLLDMFPEARFVHIRRHPYVVFQSTQLMSMVTLDWHRLQRRHLSNLDDWLIRQYRQMYAAYFQDRVLIAPGRLHEISFEDLEKDPLAQLQATYAALDLPSFEEVRPRVEQYVASLKSYRKNTFPQLPEEMRRRLAREWRQCFEAWGYTT